MGISRCLLTAPAVIKLLKTSTPHTNHRIQLCIRLCTLRLRHFHQSTNPFSKQGQSTTHQAEKQNAGTEIDIARESPYAGLSGGQKVKEVSKDVSYMGFILLSVGVLGYIIYAVFGELFSSNSPYSIYDRALARCKDDIELSAALGEPIKGYGETSRRGRRRHVRHTEYMVDDQKRMRLQFYVEGTDRKGTVQCEMVKDEGGRYNYRFLLVQLDEFPYRTFILEDNR